MGRCHFCLREDTESFWDYYCKDCTRVKAFCKLVGSDKLVKSLQFNVNKDKMRVVLNEDVTRALNELGANMEVPERRSVRLKQKAFDLNTGLPLKEQID